MTSRFLPQSIFVPVVASLMTAAAVVVSVSAVQARDLSARYTPEAPYRAINEFGVVLSSAEGAVLEVYAKPSASGMKYFCAAAEFSSRFLHTQPSDRLVIVRPEGPSSTRPGATSVLFNIVPRAEAGALPSGGVTLSPDRMGENRSVNSGKSFCKPPDRRRRDD